MGNLQLEIVTPTRYLDEGDITYVRCPGLDGSFGVMANHAPAVMALSIGEIKVVRDNKEVEYLATGGGYAEISADKVLLLVESAERNDEIDTARAEKAAERAKRRLQKKSGIDVNRARSALLRSLNRLKVAQR